MESDDKKKKATKKSLTKSKTAKLRSLYADVEPRSSMGEKDTTGAGKKPGHVSQVEPRRPSDVKQIDKQKASITEGTPFAPAAHEGPKPSAQSGKISESMIYSNTTSPVASEKELIDPNPYQRKTGDSHPKVVPAPAKKELKIPTAEERTAQAVEAAANLTPKQIKEAAKKRITSGQAKREAQQAIKEKPLSSTPEQQSRATSRSQAHKKQKKEFSPKIAAPKPEEGKLSQKQLSEKAKAIVTKSELRDHITRHLVSFVREHLEGE
jgi:hypothetical protein